MKARGGGEGERVRVKVRVWGEGEGGVKGVGVNGTPRVPAGHLVDEARDSRSPLAGRHLRT